MDAAPPSAERIRRTLTAPHPERSGRGRTSRVTSRVMHPFLTATREAATSWICTPDGRLSPCTAPGIAEVRVSREQLDRTLELLDAVVAECEVQGLEAAPVSRTRLHRAGVGVGRSGELTAIRVEERRELVRFTEEALERWRPEAEDWIWRREFEMRERGWCPRANGRLRLRLPRRHEPSPTGGWRHSFSDQPERPLEAQIGDIVAALSARGRGQFRRAITHISRLCLRFNHYRQRRARCD
jgi:hypothetical protein